MPFLLWSISLCKAKGGFFVWGPGVRGVIGGAAGLTGGAAGLKGGTAGFSGGKSADG